MHSIERNSPPISDPVEEQARVEHQVEHAAHFLPAQGPITVFIHHNTLHAFEDLSFEEGVKAGAFRFDCQAYLSEAQYRSYFSEDRILSSDLAQVLIDDLKEDAETLLGFLGTRFHLRMAMLEHPWQSAPQVELTWLIRETDALHRFRPEASVANRQHLIESTRRWILGEFQRNGAAQSPAPAYKALVDDLLSRYSDRRIDRWGNAKWEDFTLNLLWRICQRGVHGLNLHDETIPPSPRHRDLLKQIAGLDTDLTVNELLIRFCAAFLDQGFSSWVLPNRQQGFFASFLELFSLSAGPPQWRGALQRECIRLREADRTPVDSIRESLRILGVPHADEQEFITSTLLALRGWAGMIWQMETRGDRAWYPLPKGTLVEFLAARLVLERVALEAALRDDLKISAGLEEAHHLLARKIARHATVTIDQRAFQIFQLAQVRGWTPHELIRQPRQQWQQMLDELHAFSSLERRRIFHLAFERRYRVQILDAVGSLARRQQVTGDDPPRQRPKFQVICCLDDREESFRRHLEEIEPACETLGAAGFFSIPMYYRGVHDAHFVPLCPVVVIPDRCVEERPALWENEMVARRQRARQALGDASHRLHMGSRSLIGGLLTAAAGSIASVPLVMRILFPRLTSLLRSHADRLVQFPGRTRLQLDRLPEEDSPHAKSTRPLGSQCDMGFTLEEKANMLSRLLEDMGVTECLAKLVVVLGHGSSSLNNPHRSAYDCGACGGNSGAPNARALALVANDPKVRALVAQRGIMIPDDVVFVGGFHNTCNDNVTYFDLERIPSSHERLFTEAHDKIHLARQENAHERCRRFESASLLMSSEMALRHVESRSEDLAQARPECGHATNAICFVGRRKRSRGLFLDRRAFLVSYDPERDAEQTILSRILGAVVPVCGGINLEYYFSYTDPYGYGCATKLPHNVTSLLGVMDGAASDLRPGLPWQMVEIHEPVRLLFIIEARPDVMLDIMQKNEAIARAFRGRWVQLAMLDPHSDEILVFDGHTFTPHSPEQTDLPVTRTSREWYRGTRDHLPPCLVEAAIPNLPKSGAPG